MVGKPADGRGRVRLAIGGMTPQARHALETAIRIAIDTGGTIDCVFVEELALFDAAAIPITRELAGISGQVRPFEPSHLETALRRQAAEARRALERAAARARLRWQFEVVRGALLREALTRADAQDVIVIGLDGSGTPAALLELPRAALAALVDRADWQLRRRGGTLLARPSTTTDAR